MYYASWGLPYSRICFTIIFKLNKQLLVKLKNVEIKRNILYSFNITRQKTDCLN